MHVAIGPLPSSSVLAWVDYARGIVDDLAIASDEAEQLPPDLLAAFDNYLAQWSAVAERSSEFRWEIEIPAEVAEYQVHAFYRIVVRLAEEAERRGEPLQPPEGEVFYNALVVALIDALDQTGPAASEYADHLRSFWPGLGVTTDDEN